MEQRNIISQWKMCSPQLRSILRIITATLFIMSGTIKLFGFPMSMPGGNTLQMFSQVWFGGIIEAVGGALLLLGFCTRPIAFIAAGEMAVAYFQFHYPQNFWPVINQGSNAILFCFIWLYISSAGAGPWSIDALLAKSKEKI
jgi:putative oxidoreductase